MYKKLIMSLFIIISSIPTSNASDILQTDVAPQMNPHHGYVLKIVGEFLDIHQIENHPDIVSFGVQLRKSNGAYKHGWVAKIICIHENKRSEGAPLCSVFDSERALLALPEDLAKNGDLVVVCKSGLKIGQTISCKRLLTLSLEDDQVAENSGTEHLFLAHNISKG